MKQRQAKEVPGINPKRTWNEAIQCKRTQTHMPQPALHCHVRATSAPNGTSAFPWNTLSFCLKVRTLLTPRLSWASCVILEKPVNFSGPQFSHWWNEGCVSKTLELQTKGSCWEKLLPPIHPDSVSRPCGGQPRSLSGPANSHVGVYSKHAVLLHPLSAPFPRKPFSTVAPLLPMLSLNPIACPHHFKIRDTLLHKGKINKEKLFLLRVSKNASHAI